MKDGKVNGGAGMNGKMGKEGQADTGGNPSREHKKETFVCPECRKLIHVNNFVDMKSIVDDNLYYVGGVLIVGKARLLCDFQHRYDEEGATMEEPHILVAVIDAEFDQSGRCIRFDTVEVQPVK